ncbi:VWA domain-containing protein [Cellulomonas shaoxiangyii]|uniref:VWA domain-containing protein n=1 Tax=Cellulomonas shaoxiangyii TaxID=2566013 RepID=A0A4P7SJZ7_9CELL|nr:VWA domain-containing protein [Cellulomonas shaoxiangyii]QCB94492.1 VWA domain-containing protein [Cellulomonas shaoxiangyii]TGY86074.1 VWA domain-containing protein [Cellulomonas shaoxiangyii]
MEHRSGRALRAVAALASAVLAFGLAGAASAQGLSAGGVPAAVPMAVPPATGDNAVITVRVGADRQGTTGVSGLAGVTLQLYDGTTEPTTPVAADWATCVSDADGDCSFVVPDTEPGAFGCFLGAGANCDRRFWVVQTGVPSGFTANATLRTGNGDGTGSQLTAYRFRTGTTLRAGSTYSSQSAFMVGTGSTNRTASGGTWQQSRVNPAPLQQCGLRVALILDLSGSVTAPQLVQLKAAADTFVDSLVGTPSEMAVFSFSNASPATGATQNYPGLTSISTQASADAVKSRYAAWTSGGGTNWDRGLAAAAEADASYDIAVVITDGDPTFYSQPAEGPGNFNRFRETENGIFSANAVKAQGTRVLAVGVGAGVSDPTTAQNLAAISGPVRYDGTNSQAADHYQVSDYTVVGQALRQLALGECAGSLSVVKQIVGSGGDVASATPAGAGWTFGASTTSTGVTLPTPGATTDASSAVNFPITYDAGTTAGTIEVQEEPQEGTALFPVDGANAVCTDLDTGQPVAVTNAGATGFSVDVASTAAISCTVYNQVAGPASVTVDKLWVINGADPVPEGGQPPGFTSQLTLTGPGAAGATPQAWSVTRTGYVAGNTVTVQEDLTLQTPEVDLDLCDVAEAEVVEVDGEPVTPTPVTGAGYDVTLAEGDNLVVIRNTIDCESRLTLAKNVEGSAAPTLWDLAALPAPGAPAGQLPGPSGQAGSAAVTEQVVTAGVPYQLAESGGPATYVQVDQRSDLQVYPQSTGSWACNRVTSAGEVVPGFTDGLNGGVTVPLAARILCTATNQTAQLTLAKEVVNAAGGTAVASDFTLRAVPGTTPPVAGLADVEVAGAAPEDAQAVEIRPGHPYALSESGPAGYGLTGLECLVDGVPQEVTEITVGAGQSVLCTFVNADDPAQLTLRKVVEPGTTGATQTPADWTLTATPQGIEDQDPVSGDGAEGVTDVEVVAGSYALSESEVAGFDAGAWECADAAGGDVAVEDGVVALANGADVTCTITNTAQQPTLTLVKEVTNDDGGAAGTDAWTLTATGPTAGLTGVTGDDAVTDAPVAIGSYALSESGPAGYTAGTWTCADGGTEVPVEDAAVAIGLGQDVTCTIVNDDQPAELTLRKVVDAGESGATQTAADWTVTATPQGIAGQDPVSGDGADGVTDVQVAAGSYALSESDVAGFDAGAWGCVDAAGGDVAVEDGVVALANGADVTCTITNTAQQPLLTLVKEVTNDDGGTAAAGAWTLTATGPTAGRTGVTGDAAVTAAPVAIGSYALTESGPAGYTAGAWTCADGGTDLPVEDGSVAIGLGQDVTCTIVNDDQPAQLTLRKVVDPGTTGSTRTPADWTLTAAPQGIPGQDAVSGNGADGVTDVDVSAGSYALSESFVPGFETGEWGCVDAAGAPVELDQGSLPLTNGADVTCTITNTAVPSTLTLVKEVTNDDGGTAQPRDVVLTATGPTAVLTGRTGDDAITAGPVAVGSYALTEDGLPGYTASEWACGTEEEDLPVEDGVVAIDTGQDVTCTLLNDDQPGRLTLLKDVVNTGGGTAVPTDWTLAADTSAQAISGRTGDAAVTDVEVPAGAYTLSETGGPAGYTASPWTCEGGTLEGDTVTVANGETVRCTVVNQYALPLLTLVKVVVNDDGGTASPADWTLTAQGPETVSGVPGENGAAVTASPVAPGRYVLTEEGPGGYTAGWVCVNRGEPVALDGDALDLAAGDDVTCTVTNDDSPVPPPPAWTAVKESDPPSGASVQPGDVITYTIRVEPVGGASVDGVLVVDELAGVLVGATLVEGSIDASAGTAFPSGTRLTWLLPTLQGAQTLTYQVRVDDGVSGVTLRNVVTAPGAEPCDPTVPVTLAVLVDPTDDCRSTTHPVVTPETPPSSGSSWTTPARRAPYWLAATGGTDAPLALGALALLATGAAMTWGVRRRRS